MLPAECHQAPQTLGDCMQTLSTDASRWCSQSEWHTISLWLHSPWLQMGCLLKGISSSETHAVVT